MQKTTILKLACLSVLIAGCATNNPGANDSMAPEPSNVERAVSQQEAVGQPRQRAKVHTDLGRLYLGQARYDIALDEARIALDADSSYAPAHNLMAQVYMALEKNDQAEKSFLDALQLASTDPEINNDFGWFLCQNGRAKLSIGYFRVAIGNPIYKFPVKALTNAGLCSLVIKEDKQAEEYFLRALRIDPRNPTAVYWLADIAYRGGRLPEAQQRLKDLNTLIEPSPESVWLSLRVDRKLGDREGEARNMGILRRKFREAPEYQKMMRGEFD
jgi:type IV pilus assembly protein PilF